MSIPSNAPVLVRAQRALAPAVTPGLLAVFVAFGGASQNNALQVAFLQTMAVVVILAVVWAKSKDALPKPAFWVVGCAIAYLALAGAQLFPLPPGVWTELPGRTEVGRGFAQLGGALPWLPLSLSPANTLTAMIAVLPPLAMFLVPLVLRWRTAFGVLAYFIPILAAASAFIGAFQALDGTESQLYFYDPTNRAWPVGFFSNVNHQASFLLACLPFCAAGMGKLRETRFRGDNVIEQSIGLGVLALTLVVGVLVCGSTAGYILLAPVLLACYFVTSGRGANSPSAGGALLIGAGILVLCLVMAGSPFVLNSDVNGSFQTGTTSRAEIWPRAWQGALAYFPAGAGFGAFELAYPLLEDPALVDSTYAKHAHNDLLEWFLEGGLAGILLLSGVVALVAARAWRAWGEATGDAGRLKRAACVALLVLILHSFVDYPLRTFASATLAALCLAIIFAERRERAPTAHRHVSI